jgi:hypothetical protein
MSLYEEIAAEVLDNLPELTVGGSTWTVKRPSSGGDGINSSSAATVDAGERTLYVLRNDPNRRGNSAAQSPIYTAEWVCYAPLGTDIQFGDVLMSSDEPTRAYRVSGQVTTDLGMIEAPLALQPVARSQS